MNSPTNFSVHVIFFCVDSSRYLCPLGVVFLAVLTAIMRYTLLLTALNCYPSQLMAMNFNSPNESGWIDIRKGLQRETPRLMIYPMIFFHALSPENSLINLVRRRVPN